MKGNGRKSLLEENAMTTLEAAMGFLGIKEEDATDQAKDNLERLINAASGYIETMTGRRFRMQPYTEDHYGSGSQELCLNQYPVRTVESIVDKESGQEISPGSYSVSISGEIGVLYRDEGWSGRGYAAGLANDLAAGKRYLRVSYTAGYILPKDATEAQPSDLPYDLQYIIWQMVQQQWALAENGAGGLSAFSISDIHWTFDKELSAQAVDVIRRYMRWS